MKVVIDDKIPFIREAASRLFDEVVFLSGAQIGSADVKDADALIVRTRTRCDQRLLNDSKVRLVVTATIGLDHLDVEFLNKKGIAWTNCPGCNATSVAQYVCNSLLVAEQEGILKMSEITVGIVGVGHVGTQVKKALNSLGCQVLLNDPPRQELGEDGFVDLAEIAEKADVVTFHVPLEKVGMWPTYHLCNRAFLQSLKKRPLLINAARGGVVDEAALMEAIDKGWIGGTVIDTWEGEPHISRLLLQKTLIGTPHVAGYSADGKRNATQMSLEAVCRFFGINSDFTIEAPPLPIDFIPCGDEKMQSLQLYDPRRDSDNLKREPEKFEWFRNHYPLRREVWDYGKMAIESIYLT